MRITDFPELVTATGNDLLVTVDIANDLTKKIKLENLPTSIATTVALATKQNLLVSGTNIKTLNSVSLLGSGDIVLTANPSGVAGAIQFSNGSAFASDATNLFWDDTNNRLGIGTNAPTNTFEVASTSTSPFKVATTAGYFRSSYKAGTTTGLFDLVDGVGFSFPTDNVVFGTSSGLGARLGIKGSGSTSATTSLLVQNSAGSTNLRVTDDQQVTGFSGAQLQFRLGFTSAGQSISTREGQFSVGLIDANQSAALRFLTLGTGSTYIDGYTEGAAKAQNYPLFIGSRANNTGLNTTGSTTQENGTQVVFGYAVNEASSLVTINSTTRGFLPPRMTTTQKNAIATPAAGLVVYDSTTNKLCCYNGSTWNDLF